MEKQDKTRIKKFAGVQKENKIRKEYVTVKLIHDFSVQNKNVRFVRCKI